MHSKRASDRDTFARQSQIQQAQIDLEELLRLQIDEENSLRGYVADARPVLRQRSISSAASNTTPRKARFAERWTRRTVRPASRRCSTTTRSSSSRGATEVAGAAARQSARCACKIWTSETNSSPTTRTYDRRDSPRRSPATNAELARNTQKAARPLRLHARLRGCSRSACFAILFNAYRSRLNRELEEERDVTEILQRAFRSESTSAAALRRRQRVPVGEQPPRGRRRRLRRLSSFGTLALILIADVSGKGVDAAVLTAFIKFMIRGIALRHRDPGEILTEFNTVFRRPWEIRTSSSRCSSACSIPRRSG